VSAGEGAVRQTPAAPREGGSDEPAVRRGGIVIRVDGALRFVPAAVALRVVAPPRITPIRGAPPELLGIAPYEGMVVPVIAIGAARGEMIVCQHAGELLGLVGAELVHTGSFDVLGGRMDVVDYRGDPAPSLDLAAIYGHVQAGAHPGAWAR
jgi:hypothetical protein